MKKTGSLYTATFLRNTQISTTNSGSWIKSNLVAKNVGKSSSLKTVSTTTNVRKATTILQWVTLPTISQFK